MRARGIQVLIAFALACSLPLWAAQAPPAGNRAAQVSERLEQLKTRLKLTPEQVETLRPIVQKEVGEVRAVHERMGADTSHDGKAAMLREVQAVQKKYEPQISAVLTPEQKNEWQQVKEEHKQKVKEQHKDQHNDQHKKQHAG